MAVITATEGGAYDAINRYDRCIDTQGIIQWCNRAPQRSVDGLYAALWNHNPALLDPVQNFVQLHGFEYRVQNGWAGFCRVRDARRIDTPALQLELYFKGASGRRNEWSSDQRAYAQQFCAEAREVWDSLDARLIQEEWTARRLISFFVTEKANKILSQRPKTPVAEAYLVGYLSFAANNPARAEKVLLDGTAAMAGGGPGAWSLAWAQELLRRHAVLSGVAIYPDRYRKIQPVIERLFGVSFLPLEELPGTTDQWVTPLEIQRALLAWRPELELEPTGLWDTATKRAWGMFERETPGTVQDGLPGMDDLPALQRVIEEAALLRLRG